MSLTPIEMMVLLAAFSGHRGRVQISPTDSQMVQHVLMDRGLLDAHGHITQKGRDCAAAMRIATIPFTR